MLGLGRRAGWRVPPALWPLNRSGMWVGFFSHSLEVLSHLLPRGLVRDPTGSTWRGHPGAGILAWASWRSLCCLCLACIFLWPEANVAKVLGTVGGVRGPASAPGDRSTCHSVPFCTRAQQCWERPVPSLRGFSSARARTRWGGHGVCWAGGAAGLTCLHCS